MNNNLEIIPLTKQSLKEAIYENKFWSNSHKSAFALNKAKWMLENTRANDNDLLLLLGVEDNEMVAMVSFIPDILTNNQGENIKIFWSTRWWVADKYDGTVLSTYMLNEGFNQVGNQVMIKMLNSKTEKFYDKQPFDKFSKRERFIVLYSLNYSLLISKLPALKNIISLMKFIDKISGKAIGFINKNKNKRKLKFIDYNYIDTIDSKLWNFIEMHTKHDLVLKTKDYINWQIDNAQYTSTTNSNQICELFSMANKIYNVNLNVEKNGKTIGFVSGLVKNDRFLVRYFLADSANVDNVFNVLMAAFLKSKCTSFQTIDTVLGELLENSYLKVYSDRKTLFSYAHKVLKYSESTSHVYDQDGSFI